MITLLDHIFESGLSTQGAANILLESSGSRVLHSTIHLYVHEGVDEEYMLEAKFTKAQQEMGPFGLTYAQAHEIAGGLSQPSKMPGYSYGIPAAHCKLGAILHKIKGSVCHNCYALKGFYVFKSVKQAQARRFNSLDHPQWTHAMATLINFHRGSAGKGKQFNHAHFRWHDSGDIQSPEHLEKIAQVARMTPKVSHWLPTREYGMVKKWTEGGGRAPDNLVIRLSGHMKDVAGPKELGYPISSVASKGHTKGQPGFEDARYCPAMKQGGKCLNCRACWNANTGHVVYHEH
jgi:hypothetical protein